MRGVQSVRPAILFVRILLMKTKIALSLFPLLIFSVQLSYADTLARPIGYEKPILLPTDRIYFLVQWRETLIQFLNFRQVDKLSSLANQSKVRLAEIDQLLVQGRNDLYAQTLLRYQDSVLKIFNSFPSLTVEEKTQMTASTYAPVTQNISFLKYLILKNQNYDLQQSLNNALITTKKLEDQIKPPGACSTT